MDEFPHSYEQNGGVYGGLAVVGFFRSEMQHFSRSSRSSGVERHFSEPSVAKSSLPSRAPLPIKQRFANIHLSTSLSACQKQQPQPQPQPPPPPPQGSDRCAFPFFSRSEHNGRV